MSSLLQITLTVADEYDVLTHSVRITITMDELAWPDLENSAEDGDDIFNSTAAASAAWRNVANQSVPGWAVVPVGLAIMTVGVFTNCAVLAVLVRARRQFGSTAHTLITNQCAIDLYTSVLGMCSPMDIFPAVV